MLDNQFKPHFAVDSVLQPPKAFIATKPVVAAVIVLTFVARLAFVVESSQGQVVKVLFGALSFEEVFYLQLKLVEVGTSYTVLAFAWSGPSYSVFPGAIGIVAVG